MTNPRNNNLVTWLLRAGVSSSVLYAIMLIVVPYLWPAYSSVTQTVSELSAVHAPTRNVWVPFGILYALMIAAFGAGVLRSSGPSRALRIMGYLMIFYGINCFVWVFAPMHLREVLASGGETMSDTMHLVIAGIVVCTMLTAMALSATAYSRLFKRYVIFSMILLALGGIMTTIESGNVAKNLPTPWIGVWERINIVVFLVWVSVVGYLQETRTKGITSSKP